MNRWKSNSSKYRKRQVPNDAAIELPDVIANLSIGNNIVPPHLSSPDNMQSKEERTRFNYTNRYLQAIGQRDSSGPSRQIMTPLGVGASVEVSQIAEGDMYYHQALQKTDHFNSVSPSRTNSNSAYAQTFTAAINFTETPLQERYGLNDVNREENVGFHHYNDFEVQRFRSMSSEPRSPQRNKPTDKRLRCSSATRVRHNQQKQLLNTDITATSITHPYQTFPRSPALSPHTSPPLSPPMSPPSQRIHYQQPLSSSSYEPSNSQSPSLYSNLPTNNVDPSCDPLCVSSHSQNTPPSSYGYKIPDLEALLSQASLSRPANLPMVLGCSTKIHNMRPNQGECGSQPQSQTFLPLGIIVNAVCKTRDWLYVQTAHGAEGYVPYKVCLPLGILPNKATSYSNASHGETLAWECHGRDDVHHLTREATNKAQGGYINGLETTSRSRPRARRRVFPQTTESTNQTDSQKLLPAYSRTVDPRRRIRENSQNFTPRLV